LAAIARGEADVAVAAITMTPEREQLVDFSTSYFDSGLQIMVPVERGVSFLNTVRAVFSSGIGALALSAIVIVFVLANVLWLVERRTNPDFQHGYLRGILEGWWGVMLIIAGSQFGEIGNVARRLTVAAMWLLGVVLIAQFTATVTSSLTIQQLQSSISGPGDLPGKKVGTVPGTIAADYLRQIGAELTDVTTADQGFDLLKKGEVQAIVFDAPTLQYWAAKRGKGAVQVVGPVFRPEKYGIAVPQGSPLRKQINKVLLTLYDDGKYDEIRGKWFAPS
jgi:polar amino acid transport system substrate-binding protein